MSNPTRVLERADVRRMVRYVALRKHQHALRNTVMVRLSCNAGCRASEIAKLTWPMCTTASGRVDDYVNIIDSISKYRSGRRVPLHPELKRALIALHKMQGRPRAGPVIRTAQGTALRPQSVVNWFFATYREAGLEAASHAGRRHFITEAARLLPRVGGSLVDVAALAGHRNISCTIRYVQGSLPAQRAITRLI